MSARTSTRRCSWPGESRSCRSRTSRSACRVPRNSAASSSSAIWKFSGTCCWETTTSVSTRRRRTSPAIRWRVSTFAGTHRLAVGRTPSTRSTSARTSRATCRRSTSPSSAWKCGSRWRTAGWCRGSSNTATTTCSANTDRGPYYNCAYNQGRFNVEGYRYHGRVIGYTADRDAENYVLGGTFTSPDGEIWSATARTSRLNRDDFGDVRNTVASVPTTYNSLEFGWRGKLFGEKHRCGSRRRIDRARRRRTRRAALRLRSLDPRVRPVRIRARRTWLLALLATGCRGTGARRSLARAWR